MQVAFSSRCYVSVWRWGEQTVWANKSQGRFLFHSPVSSQEYWTHFFLLWKIEIIMSCFVLKRRTIALGMVKENWQMIAQCPSPSSHSLHSWMFFECIFNITSSFRIIHSLHLSLLIYYIISIPSSLPSLSNRSVPLDFLPYYSDTPLIPLSLFNPSSIYLILLFYSKAVFLLIIFFCSHPLFGPYPLLSHYMVISVGDFSKSSGYHWFDLIKLTCFPLVFSYIYISNHLPLWQSSFL